MNPTFHLYGMKITLAGDLTAARDRAHLARLLMFKTKLVNVNNLDIIQNNLRLNDGTHVHFMSQHGLDSATIYVPPGIGKGKPEYIEKPMFEVIPYIFASNTVFERAGEPAAGLLVCHGGWDFSGWHELFSPYGDTALWDSGYDYSPYVYEMIDGEHILLSWPNREAASKDANVVEWQVKEFWDYINPVKREYEGREEWLPVFWDEVPWMTRYPRWDPVFYETYEDYLTEYNGSGSTKTYWAYSTYSGVTRGVEESTYYNWPLYHTYQAEWELIINNGIVLEDSLWINQWYEGSGVGPEYDDNEATWYNKGDSGDVSDSAIDQENPSKFGVIWDTFSHEASCSGYEFMTDTWNIPTKYWTFSNYKVKFKGLGHNEILPTSGSAIIRATIRLYKIDEKYVCLFSYVVGDPGAERVYLGSAVDGGAFHVMDVTDGFEVNGETKQILTSPDRAMTFGILKRVEPVQRIKKEQ